MSTLRHSRAITTVRVRVYIYIEDELFDDV